jgi:hypothetical protein
MNVEQRARRAEIGLAIFSIVACAMIAMLSPAHSMTCQYDNNGRTICAGTPSVKHVGHVRHAILDPNGNETVVGHRPRGCPHAFCGCEASLYKFGKIIPALNLASNWIRKFPRTSPAPGMAAARSGHVMILLSHVRGKEWMVHDGNSGGGLTREHVRSISGYVIVNPDASRTTMR